MTTNETTTARVFDTPDGASVNRSMAIGSRMLYSRLIGALFLAAFVLYGVGTGLVTSVLGTPNVLSTLSAQQTPVVLGAFLMLLNSVVVVGLGALFFPVIEHYGKRTALAYFAARIVEAVLLAMGVLCLLMLMPLSQSAVAAEEANAAWAIALGSLLAQANIMAFQIAMMSLGLASLFLCVLLVRTRLIPRLLALWGFLGYALFLGGAIAEIFGLNIGIMPSIPGGLFELAVGCWLLIKGFASEAYGSRPEVVLPATVRPALATP